MTIQRLIAALGVLPALACSAATTGSPSGAPIETDKPVYVVNDSAGVARLTIHMTYRNNTGKDVFLPTCRGPQPPRLQKQVGDGWVIAFAPNVLGCEESPIMVRAGDSYEYTFNILAGMPHTGYMPRFVVAEVPGTYRVLWELFQGTTKDGNGHAVTTKDPLSIDQEISNTFQLVVR